MTNDQIQMTNDDDRWHASNGCLRAKAFADSLVIANWDLVLARDRGLIGHLDLVIGHSHVVQYALLYSASSSSRPTGRGLNVAVHCPAASSANSGSRSRSTPQSANRAISPDRVTSEATS